MVAVAEDSHLALTVEAVNWPGWCGRPLLLQIEQEHVRGALPVRLTIRERLDSLSGYREWEPDGCILRGTPVWRPVHQEREIVLKPWHQPWDRKNDRLSPLIRDDTLALRLGQEHPVARPQRLPDIGEWLQRREWPAAVAALCALTIAAGLYLNGAVHELVSAPFRVQSARLEGGRLAVAGDSG